MATTENSIIESFDENSHLFLYFSTLLGRSVFDADGARVGRLADLKVAMGELFPKITSLAVRRRRKKGLWELDWTRIHSLNAGSVGRSRAPSRRSGRSTSGRTRSCSAKSSWTSRSSTPSGPRSSG